MDIIERVGNRILDNYLDNLFVNKLQKRARSLYNEISQKIDELPSNLKTADRLLVILNSANVVTTGFWAKFYEDCAAGIEYAIKDRQERKTLAHGEMPMHKAPWKYNRASIEGAVVANMVARHLVTRQNRYGANIIVSSGKNNETTYSSCNAIPVIFHEFPKETAEFRNGSKFEVPREPQMSFEVLVRYPLPEISG